MTIGSPIHRPRISIAVVEKRKRSEKRNCCVIGEHIRFNEKGLLSYCFAEWQPVVFDMLVVAAAVEFCDRIQKRPALGWSRDIELEIPVHEQSRWDAPEVQASLTAALGFLTGDRWTLNFVSRKSDAIPPQAQGSFALPAGVGAILPFSDGMDSRAAATLFAKHWGEDVLCVRLGTKKSDKPRKGKQSLPFTTLPYKVASRGVRLMESSNRSRGFKFTLVAGIAAYLSKVKTIVVPESGQGALGPALVPVVHAYPDYRNHPSFTDKMESFLAALLKFEVTYTFPRLWFTKGETLKAFADETQNATAWDSTWSCWQQNRHVPVDGRKRQCGICAACMLRRTSVHAAGLSEPNDRYVWENLSAATFEEGAAPSFSKSMGALRQHALAGTLHLEHLAGLAGSARHSAMLKRNAAQLASALGISGDDAETNLAALLYRHRDEWRGFLNSLSPNSFVRQWAGDVS